MGGRRPIFKVGRVRELTATFEFVRVNNLGLCKGNKMTTGGWIFMTLSISSVLLLVIYTVGKVLLTANKQ